MKKGLMKSRDQILELSKKGPKTAPDLQRSLADHPLVKALRNEKDARDFMRQIEALEALSEKEDAEAKKERQRHRK